MLTLYVAPGRAPGSRQAEHLWWARVGAWLVPIGAVLTCSCTPEGDDAEGSGSMSSSATTASVAASTGTTGQAGSVSEGSAGLLCEDVSECTLYDDCCVCVAIHMFEDPGVCNMLCQRPRCEQWGITEILCTGMGSCELQPIDCDPRNVSCDDEPPGCEPGLVPRIEGDCWSSNCVPPSLCTPTERP